MECYNHIITNSNPNLEILYVYQFLYNREILYLSILSILYYTVDLMLRISKKCRVKMCAEFDKMSNISVTE